MGVHGHEPRVDAHQSEDQILGKVTEGDAGAGGYAGMMSSTTITIITANAKTLKSGPSVRRSPVQG